MPKRILDLLIEYKPVAEVLIIFINLIFLAIKVFKPIPALIKRLYIILNRSATLEFIIVARRRLGSIFMLSIGLIIQLKSLIELLRQLF